MRHNKVRARTIDGQEVVASLDYFIIEGTSREEVEKNFNLVKEQFPDLILTCRTMGNTTRVNIANLTFVERYLNPLSPRKEY
jgi:hypothetical protein